MEPTTIPTRQGYDLWAEIYDVEGNPLVALEEPEVDRRLGDVHELDLLDVGCGTGRHSVRLARRGARVVAVDFSLGMLSKARAKSAGTAVRFVEHDLAAPLPFAERSFDRVVCGLVLDHIKPLAPPSPKRWVACAGRTRSLIVVSLMHPAMMLKGVQARFTDPASGKEIRPQSFSHQITDYGTPPYTRAYACASYRSTLSTKRSRRACLAPRATSPWPLLFMMENLAPR